MKNKTLIPRTEIIILIVCIIIHLLVTTPIAKTASLIAIILSALSCITEDNI